MAPLLPLATAAELAAYLNREFTEGEVADAERRLISASAAVRRAAGVPISQTTSTVSVAAECGRLRLPGRPIASVASVIGQPGGRVITFRARGSTVLLDSWSGWSEDYLVTYTHGWPAEDIPQPIIDLVLSLAGQALLVGETEGAPFAPGNRQSWRVDDAGESYYPNAGGPESYMAISEATRAWLRQDYGAGNVQVVSP